MVLNEKEKRYIGAIFLLILFTLWLIFLYNFPPTEIVEFIGINNGYVLTFFGALLGGTSILVPFPYHILIFTLAAGGLNPFFLGLLAGLGIFIGDSTSYFIGYTGREIVTGKPAALFERFHKWVVKKPKWILPIFLFLYSSVIPTPNDLLVIPLGLVRYPYIKVIIPLLLGSIVFNTLLAFAGFYGFEWVASFF